MFLWGHGLLSSMAAEDRLGLIDWSVLVGDGWRVVRYDARGHGESPGDAEPASYRWGALSEDQLRLVDGPFVVGGASMGAATALTTAVAAPGRVRALVLVIPPTAWSTRPRQSRLYRIGANIVGTMGGGLLDFLARAAPTPPALRPRDARDLLAVDGIPKQRIAAIMRGAADSDLPDEQVIAAIDVPALILAWSGDDGHPLTTAERLHDLLGSSSLHIADTRSDLDRWTARVREFLAPYAPGP